MNERDMQTMNDQDLVNALREHAEWAQANEWETPITLGDDLVKAADRIEAQAKEIEKLRAQLRHLEELAEADRDGRLVVPPCKVGDTVWAASGKIIKCEIDEMYLCDGGGIEYLVTFDCDGADCKRCPFNRWEQDCSGERYCECEYGCSSFKDSDIGKTIFLTSEEAKAALEATKDGN